MTTCIPQQYLEEDEKIPVDPRKIEYEHAMLCKLYDLYNQSVPIVYVLDVQRNASKQNTVELKGHINLD